MRSCKMKVWRRSALAPPPDACFFGGAIHRGTLLFETFCKPTKTLAKMLNTGKTITTSHNLELE